MNVSITGGSGFIGKLLLAALSARGDRITQLSRRDDMQGGLRVALRATLYQGGKHWSNLSRAATLFTIVQEKSKIQR